MFRDYQVTLLMKIEAGSPEEAAQKAKRRTDADSLLNGLTFRVKEAPAIMPDLAEGEHIVRVNPTCEIMGGDGA